MLLSNLRKVSCVYTNMLRSKINKAAATTKSDDVSSHKPKRLRPSNSNENLQSTDNNNSKYFEKANPTEISQQFLNIQLEFNADLKNLTFKKPVAYKYNPLEYAFGPNECYVRKYCRNTKKLLFIGMNPGPFGMCQTGVPFGEIKSVRDWLQVEGEIGKPEIECPTRPIQGFQCPKTEVSGDRLWNLLKKLFVEPEKFFNSAFVYNYCPLAFMKTDGGNLTPTELQDPKPLEEICDKYLLKVIELLKPEIIIGIGKYIEKRSKIVLKENNLKDQVKVLYMPHPSPRAVNNHNWPEKGEKFFNDNDLLKYFSLQ